MPVPDLTKPANASAMVAAEMRTNFTAIGTAVKVRASHNVDVALPGGNTLQPFNAETTDSDGLHDVAVNNSRFTVPAGFGGWYDVVVRARFSGPVTPTGYRLISLLKNSAGVYNAANIVAQKVEAAVTSTSTYSEVQLQTKLQLSAGDYLEVFLSHNQGVAINSQAVSGALPLTPSFEMTRVGA